VLQALDGWLHSIEPTIDIQVSDTHPQSVAEVWSRHEREKEIKHEWKVFGRDIYGDTKDAARDIGHLRGES
jgi:hypothetical protein